MIIKRGLGVVGCSDVLERRGWLVDDGQIMQSYNVHGKEKGQR